MESLRGVCSSKYNANFKLLLRIELIPRVCFLLLAFRKVNTNSEEVNREIYVFFHSERKEDFIKSCLFIRLFYVLHHHFETKQLHMFLTIYVLLCFPTHRLSALALDHFVSTHSHHGDSFKTRMLKILNSIEKIQHTFCQWRVW